MLKLQRILEAGEDWLMQRVLSYALARGYTKYTSTLQEAWRLSIHGLSEALIQSFQQGAESLELSPDDCLANDPASSFAVHEAHLHRTRGVSLSMFLGLLKYYRRSYLDLLVETRLSDEDRVQYHDNLLIFFDRLEICIAEEWCTLSEQGKLDELREANRTITSEKNRYLTLFESLAAPVVFIGTDGHVQNMNQAALEWLGFDAAPGAIYHQAPSHDGVTRHNPDIFLDRRADQIFPWLAEPMARMLAGNDTSQTFQQSYGNGDTTRQFLATLSTNKDFGGQFDGLVLVIQDITELSSSKAQLSDANSRLEAEVRKRTREYEDAIKQLRSEVRERELYQQALTESAALYRAVVEDQGELICRFSVDGTILFANMAYTRIFGSELLTQPKGQGFLLHEGEDRPLAELIHKVSLKNPVLTFEQQATTATGAKIWINWTCRGIFNSEGVLEACQIVGGDVTRARQAEQALRELNESLEKTVKERTDTLEERAKSFERMNANLTLQIESRRRAEKALALAVTEEQLKMRQITALYDLTAVLGTHWETVQEMLCQAVEALQQGWRNQGSTVGEIVFDNHACRSQNYQDGCDCMTRPLLVFGSERGSVKICRVGPCDISDDRVFEKDEETLLTSMARQVERALEAHLSHTRLAESEREFREFFDNAAEAIIIHDEYGKILDTNKNSGIWLNIATESAVGMSLLDFVVEDDKERLAGHFMNAAREAPELFQTTLKRKDGFSIPVEMLCQAQDFQGRKVLVSSARNISKRQQAELESRRRMDQEMLLSGISTRLVNAIGAEVPKAMRETLAEICAFVGMQRAAVYTFDDLKKRFELVYQWHDNALSAMDKALTTLGRYKTPWLYERSLDQEVITIRNIQHLPPAAKRVKKLFADAGIANMIAIPMRLRGKLQGLFMVADKNPEALPAPDSQLLLQFAPMFSNVILRQRIRHALNESANLTASILNALSTFLCVLDKKGVITLVNRTWQQQGSKSGPAMAATLGVGDNYLAYCRVALEAGDEQAGQILEGISSVISGHSNLFRFEFSSRSGPVLNWFQLEVTPRGRGIRGCVVSHLNITAKKRAERRLSRNEARYRNLIEALHEGLLLVRKGNIMAYLNDQFAKMLGRPRASLLGRTPEEYVAEESRSRLMALLSPGAETKHAEEIVWIHAEGRRVYSLVSTSKNMDDEGNIIGTFAVVTDTTDRKVLESQLLQSQKLEAIGQLAAGIAHEINTPAQYVGNNVQFIKGAFEDIFSMCSDFHQLLDAVKIGPVSREQVLAVEKSMADRDIEYLSTEIPGAISQTLEGIERISTIVRSVKQFAHPGSTSMAPANLNEAMLSTVTVSRNEWKYVADFETDLDKDLPLVPCMIGEINQVILNLIVNAAHAIADAIKDNPEQKGRITLATKFAPPWAEIRIKDTGTGIPPEVQAKIFDPFFTTKEVGKGTGQGLTISRSIIMDKHHGQLYFETEPGLGTTFVVCLPLTQEEVSTP